ncbi:hypothetical protein A2714_02685 [Candidatus Woesebacteria bacterium RIFCSPHIGHO2_01_FULL_38_9]|uniref:Uncharacterized protein n=2 Tax=Candidatus Woeseibacteriota TaxID=1752722 RepID=A0A1F7Y542_9BACT|nr:MAG: hypothetical protein A2714_02685 [Candidatus Woesebacteria bacterium RIFCSPHIGHO2_01_FULL_38_9]OGM59689.1 MAG: hypothetical protein A3A75_00905 [Candidatus Woesebacteria bacterium RIFCSPLOWO2_01_FULL_39_10]
MKEFLKGKVVTGVVVIATVVLAGVAIFTALRLYQLRRESVAPTAPESEPAAWDCSKYTFSVSGSGVVAIQNQSTRDEPAQQARVSINGTLVTTLNVPALPKGQNATLGTVQVPQGAFSWEVVGTKDCRNSGTASGEPVSCEQLTFKLVGSSPTVTPTITPTVTTSPTPTDRPIGGTSPTPTPTTPPGATSTPTPTQGSTTSSTSTPTPTQGAIAAISPTPSGDQLPSAGIGMPTIAGIFLGILLIVGALILAF